MSEQSFLVRRLNRPELDRLLAWAADEGWNPGLADAESFWAADPQGFFGGELDGDLVGGCAAVVYDDRFAFFGLYLMRAEHRGRGFGLQMTRRRLEYIGSRNAGLDGVVAMQDRYERIGFRIAHRNIRYGGRTGGESPSGCESLVDIPFEEIFDYDRRHFGAPRREFLKHWIRPTGGLAVGVRRSGKLVGFGAARPCRIGFKIGPLFADDEEVARRIFRTLASALPAGELFLDVPEPNRFAVKLAVDHGMRPVFETGRMYLAGPPDFPLPEVYGISTFELG